jgi:tight adherence protein C
MTARDEVTSMMLNCCIEIQTEKIENIQQEIKLFVEEVKRAGTSGDKKQKDKAKKLKKKLEEEKKLFEKYENGKIVGIDMIPVAGYKLMQLLKWDSSNQTVKKLYQKCCQFKEKKEAIHYTYYLLGALFGYAILGMGAFFVILGITLTMGLGTRAVIVAGVVLIALLLMGYIPYDNVNAVVTKRKESIENEFPKAVSKMALLTVAGMEVNQAWKLTCESGKGTLYDEMRRVIRDLDNNVSPVEAYSKFITRCDNKYTTKLATSIIQNISKGNSEIAALFKSLNDESWMEHKHNARRMGEKIQSKLLIPTILMFIGILILVMVPVMSGFDM